MPNQFSRKTSFFEKSKHYWCQECPEERLYEPLPEPRTPEEGMLFCGGCNTYYLPEHARYEDDGRTGTFGGKWA